MAYERKEIWVFLLLSFTSVNIFVITKAEVQQGRAVHVNELDNLLFNKYHLMDVPRVSNSVRCASLCGRFSQCRSFFYNKPNQTCRLHHASIFRRTDGIAASSWTFFIYGEPRCPIHLGFISLRSNFCIYLALNTSYNFADGQRFCDERNSRIISLNTSGKRKSFRDLMTVLMENPDLHRMIYQKQFYLNLQRGIPDWQWGSGGSISWSEIPWGPGQPLCPVGPCNCMSTLQVWNWNWNDLSCTERHRLVCEYAGPLK